MQDKEIILPKFRRFKEITSWDKRKLSVYVLVNFNTISEQDLERIYILRKFGYSSYVMVYEKDFSAEANAEMRLYNATMKINRLEMLKANIGLELLDGFDGLQKYFDEILTDRTIAEFERQAGILGKTIHNNAKAAHAIVNASFNNAKFSDRIWMYQGMMKAELSKLLQEGLIQGRNPRQLARHLEKLFGVSKQNAERLMRTELARVQTEAQKQSFIKNGFTQYEFIALGSACEICANLDGKHFDVDKMMPGENAPPMHPNCRCSVAAYEDDEEYEAWLDYLDKGGTTEEWEELKNKNQYEMEKSSVKNRKYSVQWDVVKHAAYRDKFEKVYSDANVQELLYEKSVDILKHRQGTDYEDMHLINRFIGKVDASQTKVEYTKGISEELKHNRIWYNDEIKRAVKKNNYGTYITIHNHAESKPPSGGDFDGAFTNGYYAGLNICHDGTIYYYKVGKKRFSGALYDATVAKYQNRGYNEIEAYEATLNQFVEDYGIIWRKL